MSIANFFKLSGHGTHVIFNADPGGPLTPGGPALPVSLEYTHGTTHVVASGADLEVQKIKTGRVVTAVINKSGIVPGAFTYFSVVIPDTLVTGGNVTIHTLGFLTVHRPTANIGPGQEQIYTEIALQGTAAAIVRPL